MTNLVKSVFSIYTSLVNSHFCNKLYLQIIALIFVLSWSVSTQATIFNFDLRGSDAALVLDGKNAGQLVNNGLIAIFSAGPGALIDEIFNQTSSRFGINSVGTSADSASLIDAANGLSEFLTVSFSQSVVLGTFTLSAFAPGEIASLSIAGASPLLLPGLVAAQDFYDFSNITLDIGEQLRLSYVSGNGFSFDHLTVSTVQVPEPAIFMLILTGIIAVIILRRSNNKGQA